MITRWDQWFSDENLEKDSRILAAPPSKSAENAAQIFLAKGKRNILELACGIGRDTFHLENRGLEVIGVDAAFNGIRVAQQIKSEQNAAAEFLAADARQLPFEDGTFEGIYCFGLLHEFTSETWEDNTREVMSEIKRLLRTDGILVLTVIAGEPGAGLPHVQVYSRQMFDAATEGWHTIEVRQFEDVGCTGREDYHIWYGIFKK